jgi:hypothetical protein
MNEIIKEFVRRAGEPACVLGRNPDSFLSQWESIRQPVNIDELSRSELEYEGGVRDISFELKGLGDRIAAIHDMRDVRVDRLVSADRMNMRKPRIFLHAWRTGGGIQVISWEPAVTSTQEDARRRGIDSLRRTDYLRAECSMSLHGKDYPRALTVLRPNQLLTFNYSIAPASLQERAVSMRRLTVNYANWILAQVQRVAEVFVGDWIAVDEQTDEFASLSFRSRFEAIQSSTLSLATGARDQARLELADAVQHLGFESTAHVNAFVAQAQARQISPTRYLCETKGVRRNLISFEKTNTLERKLNVAEQRLSALEAASAAQHPHRPLLSGTDWPGGLLADPI